MGDEYSQYKGEARDEYRSEGGDHSKGRSGWRDYANDGRWGDPRDRQQRKQDFEEAEKVEVKSNLTVLNITDKEASPEEIKKAYLTMVKKYHPDLTPTGATPEEREAREERFKEVTRAYDSLKEGVMFEQ